MRIVLWLAIAVFLSSLFWPRLLNDKDIVYCLIIFFVLLILPRLRTLAVIPLLAIYITFYTHLALTGSLPPSWLNRVLPFSNSTSLQTFVDKQDHSIIVEINSLISIKNRGYFTAKLIEIDGNHLNYSPLLEMRWYKPTLDVQAGEVHAFKVRFKPVYGRANPAGFDRQKWRYSNHVAYQATIKAHLFQQSARRSFRAFFYQKVTTLSNSLNHQGIILALSFADKTLISSEKKDLIQKLAIAHLFAISGLHIGLLFSFVYLLVQQLVKRFCVERYLGWFAWRLVNFTALSGALFYVYLAGFSLPTQRAFLMLLFAVVVLSLKRKCALVDLLGVTLLVILLWDPLSVLSLSLWLSFAAVTIILIIIWRFPGVAKQHKDNATDSLFAASKRYLSFLFFIQLSLTLLMIPIQLLSFSGLSWLSPFINFVAVPLFSVLIIPLILLGCLFSLIAEPIALLLFSTADVMINFFFTFFAWGGVAYQSYSGVYCELIIMFVSLVVTLFVLYFLLANNRKTSLLFSGLLLTLFISSFWKNKLNDSTQWFVEVFDVGQGLAVLVRSQGQTLLYDTGPSYPSGFSTAKSEIVPYLDLLGIRELDYLVISHSDIDHAGGFTVIRNAFKPKHIIFGEPLLKDAAVSEARHLCRAGDSWSFGLLSIAALSPFSVTENNNNNSCVLRISDGKHALLLTGDIDKKQELLLLEHSPLSLPSDLLFAPHHGSKHSSSRAFINRVAPRWGIFTAGFMNQWGFPAAQVKSLYEKQGIKTVNTGLQGFIRFTITQEKIKMQTYREDLAPYWYHHSFSL
ncbi:DNA internalization-related competence protein ComEC/Rec2 [Psychromonas antarctica]|uniref:DNA internalization-related competence protein ComEC/Rec2 n=1 Tax=Psychromonas antarctica TaxID=67573 RepID=UPI001EE885CB|nr:DNA internalization-related competence protein ComEC/Rec2 [Psychromonas antarctica]MCG6199996.1 DNA internalization-related competence protein ComEC/Rec2 [Psychromonas antarctica]